MTVLPLRPLPALAALALLATAACVPGAAPGGPAPDAARADTAIRHLVRPVPVPDAFRAAVARGTRTETGAPGARYWQQRVRYTIRAELDPATAALRGRSEVAYENRSPDTLRTVVVKLYQNIFTETARRNRVAPNTGGVTLHRVAAQGTELEARPAGEIGVTAPVRQPRVGYAVQGTLMRIALPRPILPGETATLAFEWSHRVPPAGAFRTAWEDALDGRVFNVAQWYPQIAVYDDLVGWDTQPYLGDGEFYLEYGDFDVSLTLPAGWLVAATGTLRNPGEVLTDAAQRRLAAAVASDSALPVVTAEEARAGTVTRAAGPDGRLTWRFEARDVRDFAWAASDRYAWDAARAPIRAADGSVRAVAAHAFYRPGAPGWERTAGYARHAVSFFSDRLIPYPYPQITVVEGPIGGMEYPMMVFNPRARTAESLYAVTAHEIAHMWFPMLVGSNEASYAWMDEGPATFYEDDAVVDVFPGSDAPLQTLATYLSVAGRADEVPLMRHTDLVSPYGLRVIAAYTKPAALLQSLRATVGDSTFARAMRTYATEWSYRHPTPWDFFHTVERVAGEDLDGFWYPWWFETGRLDQAIGAVEPVDGGVRVTVRDLGTIPGPTVVEVTTDGGLRTRAELPIEVWTEGRVRSASLVLPALGTVVRVEVDPDRARLDVNRDNNVWTAPAPAAAP